MTNDYSTTLFTEFAPNLKPRQVERSMKVLDRQILRLFTTDNRELVLQLLPGLSSRRFGSRFGVQPKALRASKSLPWSAFIATIQREAKIKSQQEAENLVDAYLRAHVFLMTPKARLSFAAVCPDDVMRSYLRALN